MVWWRGRCLAGYTTPTRPAANVTRYVVVTREHTLPVERFMSIEAAADFIVRERAFGKWKVLAQEANKITAATPYRQLLKHEKQVLDRKLFPTLYE